MSSGALKIPGGRLHRGLHLRGLTWLVWRQNRTVFLTGLAAATALAVYAAVQHQHVTTAVTTRHLDACRGGSAKSVTCVCDLLGFGTTYQLPLRRPLQAMLLLPFLFGLFLGGPQLAQVVESGTYRMVSTQSVTRMRLFAAKLGVPLAMTVIISGVIAAAMTWWWHPVAATMGLLFTWYTWYPFYGIGPVVVGLSVLFHLLGTTLGLVLRRTVTAMGATLAAGAALFAALERVRPHLWPARTVYAQHTTQPPTPDGAWLMSDGPLSADSRRVGDVTGCYAQNDFRQCLHAHGISGHWATYHPASHMWHLQWAATGVCLALGAALVAFSVWWIRRHPA
ncbi:ABC transporter permease [Streptomyces spiralis]